MYKPSTNKVLSYLFYLVEQIIKATAPTVIVFGVAWATWALSEKFQEQLDKQIPMGPYVTANHLSESTSDYTYRYFTNNTDNIDKYLVPDSLDIFWKMFRKDSDLNKDDFLFLFNLITNEPLRNQQKYFGELLDDANQVARITGSQVSSFISPLNAGWSKIILVFLIVNSLVIGFTFTLPAIRRSVRKPLDESELDELAQVDAGEQTQVDGQHILPQGYPIQYYYALVYHSWIKKIQTCLI